MDAREAEVVADAFDVLSDPLRVRILTTLWEEDRRGPTSYSELQSAVGVRDSGRFNYHLSKLTDRYLRKVDDGYRLSPTGLQVVDLVESGAFGEAPDVDDIETDTPCPACGRNLVARYDDAEHVVDCPDCGLAVSWLTFPPAGVEQRRDDPEALLEAFSVRSRRMAAMGSHGVCPFCGREMDATLVADEDAPLPYMVRKHCDGCHGTMRSSPGAHLHDHPAVVAFLWDQGDRLDDRPLWEWPFVLGEGCSVVSEEPLRVRQTIERDGERLELDVDADAEVAATRRVRE
ncbi:winged helix-turn-helix domain-containing protein [Halorarius halobius]|uniref:winged helix-turn-helix domain-containing protein n=1 Tax=Halorarius halobius TaxID=2962671 RepID=UPI0020CE112F|nr:winged helix-turn-helix domain-containing protein [Halorarius halobius]